MDSAATNPAENGAAEQNPSDSDGLLNRLELIESQPLDQRALGFEQLHDELLAELQRSDHDGA